MSKFYRDKEGRIVTTIMPRGWITRGDKLARIDWPPARELAACVGTLVPAMIVGLARGAAWVIVRAVRRARR